MAEYGKSPIESINVIIRGMDAFIDALKHADKQLADYLRNEMRQYLGLPSLSTENRVPNRAVSAFLKVLREPLPPPRAELLLTLNGQVLGATDIEDLGTTSPTGLRTIEFGLRILDVDLYMQAVKQPGYDALQEIELREPGRRAVRVLAYIISSHITINTGQTDYVDAIFQGTGPPYFL